MLKIDESKPIDMFNYMVFEKLVPKDHFLLSLDKELDFSFTYEIVKDRYSFNKGRAAKDPAMMFKILLLEYLYNLSDVEIVERIKSDVAFRWFLGLMLDDPTPDDTTISYFRVNRLKENDFDLFFNGIVKKCIEKKLVGSRRYLIDSTDVSAKTNYPSAKKLVYQAMNKCMKTLSEYEPILAAAQHEEFNQAIEKSKDENGDISEKTFMEATSKSVDMLFVKIHGILDEYQDVKESFGLLYDIIDQYKNNKKDKIVSTVDPDARVAHKSPGTIKRGYKNHIIVDEDSEIILESCTTPFNVVDGLKLKELIEKVEDSYGLKPNEVSCDKAYDTQENRGYLKDNQIVANIDFYEERTREKQFFGLKDFIITEDLSEVKCPMGKTTSDFRSSYSKANHKHYKVFRFKQQDCINCPLKNQCLHLDNRGKQVKKRTLDVPIRYDAVLRDKEHNKTEAFQLALKKRCKVERRFATMVKNHGLRMCRYLRNRGAHIHIALANTACNIVRMLRLISLDYKLEG